ncbi:MAG: hypothetical protein ACOC2W_01820 [bacterium]
MYRNMLFLIFIMLFSIGCAGKVSVVDKNNIKLPTTTYTSKDYDTNIEVETFIASMIKDEKSKNYKPLNYLKTNNKLNELDVNVKKVSGKIKIKNPENKFYYVRIVYELFYDDNKFPYIISNVLYEGSSLEKVFQFSRDIDNKNPITNCLIIIGKGESYNLNFDKNSIFEIKTKYQRKEVIKEKE